MYKVKRQILRMKYRIEQADRLMAYLKGELPDAEREKLEQEMARDQRLAQLVEQLRDRDYVSRELERMHRFDVNHGLRRLRAAIDARETVPTASPAARRLRWRPWLSAAAVALFVVGSAVLWHQYRMRVSPLEIPQEIVQAMEKSRANGQTGAEITRMAGEKTPADVVAVLERSEMDEDVRQELLHAMRVKTYVDKEYWVALPDGSLAHLAPGTHLIYPERFRSATRDVYLDGEAYFMVAHSKGNRFVVHTAAGDVTEYGTEFDVDTRYAAGTRVVLVEGSISVKPSGGQEQMVVPGEQAEFGTGSVLISKTDVAPYRAWNTGKVEFADWTLERLMTVMAKWYGVEVEYGSPDMRRIKVSGNFDRYDDIRPTVEALSEITGLRMKIEGRKIMINQ